MWLCILLKPRLLQVRQLGLPRLDLATLITSEMKIPISPEQYITEAAEIQWRTMPTAPLLPGAERLIRHLHHHRVPIAVATSTYREAYRRKIANHADVFSLFGHVVNGTDDPDVVHGKPAPDIFQVCAARFPGRPAASDCLVLEDSPAGVRAGLAAGCQVVMLPDERMWDTPQYIPAGVSQVLRSWDDFQPELFGLPKF